MTTNTRPPRPADLIAFESMQKPHYCHNCGWYTPGGECDKYEMRPPLEFSQVENDCPEWWLEIPF
jgi:hypothetical protein